MTEELLDDLLSLIESRELMSLKWGYVDGSLAHDEVLTLAHGLLAGTTVQIQPDELIETLVERRLLFEFDGGSGVRRLRSRFAEGVRLLTRLRQILHWRSWYDAPDLISDYRVDVRPRFVARRDIPAVSAIGELGLLAGDIRYEAIRALLHGRSGELALSRFQLAATRQILHNQGADRGVVISSSTGSGKTLAFYLPALSQVASWVQPGDYWVKAVAIYPRIELLKDQVAEVYALSERLTPLLSGRGLRPIILGTFFSLTPANATPDAIARASWRRVHSGFVCPYLTCPTPGCGAEMIWLTTDAQAGREQLTCRKCGHTVGPDRIRLTRQSAKREVPDILFLTAEMLHQRLSDTRMRFLLGWQPKVSRRVKLALLDEVHTYEGTTGAQSALTLRRWRHLLGAPVQMVGLSATLREARRFFSDLTGLREDLITEVAPSDDELEPTAAEYQLILRGDPVSRTSLLSASIQASFLLARLLDYHPNPRSAGRFGSRLFVFTDDLDVTNRLYDDLRDAEGYDPLGGLTGRPPLADYRSSAYGYKRGRDAFGQDWRFVERIGWNLGQPLCIGRTSSQDRGVDRDSNVVVATSALEVGFDDNTVGAVLQHKSPHSLASFVQRKGRAGRTRLMRPWLVTVLSDYGRDRLTYQFYEQLFDPALPPQRLPVHNRYILRMQATASLIDWLADRAVAMRSHYGWWWSVLNGPAGNNRLQRDRQEFAAELLKRLLMGDDELLQQLRQQLRGALQITSDEVEALLWEAPRSLMLEVIPTLARRLGTDWQVAFPVPGGPELDTMAPRDAVHPLPDFMPPNLFSDLNLPEVTIVLPPTSRDGEQRLERMAIVQALGQLAPGRVTRRFAPQQGQLSHWVPVLPSVPVHRLPIGAFCTQRDYLGEVAARATDGVAYIPCYRPITAAMTAVPPEISPNSNSRLDWQSELLPGDNPISFPLAQTWGWGAVVRAIDFHLHRAHNPLTVRRFASAATATIYFSHGSNESVVRVEFTDDDGRPAAIGFEQEADALSLRLTFPQDSELAHRANASPDLPAWRAQFFRDLVMEDSVLQGLANQFQRDWLQQIYLSALIARAWQSGSGLEQAAIDLGRLPFEESYEPVMNSMFRIREDCVDDNGDKHGPLAQNLAVLLHQSDVLGRLTALAVSLWQPDPQDWGRWLRQRVHESLGGALVHACYTILPTRAATEDLVLDLDRGARESGQLEIWLTEPTPGGTGVVESIAEAFAADQRALFSAMEAALTPTDLEIAAHDLDQVSALLVSDQSLAAAAADVRSSLGHSDRLAARSHLLHLLAERGIAPHHALVVALEHRLLRPGMDEQGDHLLHQAVTAWRALEQRLGVSVNLRVCSYLLLGEPELGPRLETWLSGVAGTSSLTRPELAGVLAGVLWPRPTEVRGHALQSYSPFRVNGYTDAQLVRQLLFPDDVSEVAFSSTGWIDEVRMTLAQLGRVRLRAPVGQAGILRDRLLYLIGAPIDFDYLQFYPVIEQVSRDADTLAATLVLREVAWG